MRTLDYIIENASEIFTSTPEGPLKGGCVAVGGGDVVYVGPAGDCVAACGGEGWREGKKTRHIDASGQLVTPGLIDAHTHLIFAGDRADEYAARCAGVDYATISRQGGGIAATVTATRQASLRDLMALGRARLDNMLALGVTTVESKSGYGLDLETEMKILEAGRQLDASHPIDLVNTFLGAHAIPREFCHDRRGYIDFLCQKVMPKVAEEQFAEFCDVFVENIAFSISEAREILQAARALGMGLKLHADQLTSFGGAELAAEMGAVSADHLERVSDAGIAALAKAGTVAVLLPGAALFLGDDARAPARRLIEASVPVALASDFNPGTCMTENLCLCMTLGMSRLGLSPREVLEAVTCNAARAIGLEDSRGQIAAGRSADLVIFDVPSHVHLPYHFGVSHTVLVMKDGEVVWKKYA